MELSSRQAHHETPRQPGHDLTRLTFENVSLDRTEPKRPLYIIVVWYSFNNCCFLLKSVKTYCDFICILDIKIIVLY